MATDTHKVKHSGQVFTPDYLVDNILDCAGYVGSDVLRRHVVDNSCGDGAFMCAFVVRYIQAFLAESNDKKVLKCELEKFVHGIEIDSEAYSCCLDNLDSVAAAFGLEGVRWDIRNDDALNTTCYSGMMDYVIGNPPYVRVHNLDDTYDRVKSYIFANGGMTDLYLVFFELGLAMLKDGGTLCYITPSSWINSLAGKNMRDYISYTQCVSQLIDLGHFQPFEATTYTLITKMQKGKCCNSLDYYSYDGEQRKPVYVDTLPYSEIFFQGNLQLGTRQSVAEFAHIVQDNFSLRVQAKNGFATLADKVFIADEFPFDDYVIDVIKGSTGKWRKAFFPYDSHGKPIPKEKIFSIPELSQYLNSHKKDLLKKQDEADCPEWYLYGRTQALKDVFVPKVAVNTVIKDVKSVKVNEVKAGCGVYSGLYITGADYADVCAILKSQQFINYVRMLKKYKSGGYYTFNSKDLAIFLNYHLGKRYCNNNTNAYVQRGLFDGYFQVI